MAITDDLRKTLSDPTPLYFAAGAADLALQEVKKVPALVEQLRTEAPARFEAVRESDPKARAKEAGARAKEAGVKAGERAKEAQETLQTKVGEFVTALDGDFKKLGTTLDADLKRLGESAQDLALRGVGVAAEYAVKARETYEKVAEHGEQAVKTWRGEAAEEIQELAVAVEVQEDTAEKPEATATTEAKADEPKATAPEAKAAPAKKAPAKKATPRKAAAKKTTPPAK
ncbi:MULTISPECIES: hypothetical protein [unclassified Streptomyces]|uniref:hypothetical protein n=1 Tax=unclassified Streptomyces TaxID=2593676 RepID=UPI000DD994DE|nr:MULTISPECIES: hypothetical protein [unclassified Streptomyces]QZZ28613.1 hypothetical protein A7X85_22135 [Streptomyces sp. ST1015]